MFQLYTYFTNEEKSTNPKSPFCYTLHRYRHQPQILCACFLLFKNNNPNLVLRVINTYIQILVFTETEKKKKKKEVCYQMFVHSETGSIWKNIAKIHYQYLN